MYYDTREQAVSAAITMLKLNVDAKALIRAAIATKQRIPGLKMAESVFTPGRMMSGSPAWELSTDALPDLRKLVEQLRAEVPSISRSA